MPDYTQDFSNLSGDVCNPRLAKLGVRHMKKITKLIYAAFTIVMLAMGAITAKGALNDLYTSINGDGANGGGFIYQYTPTGVQSIFASSLDRPRGVAFGSSSNLFVATSTLDPNTGNLTGAILKIAPDGTQTTFANVSGPSASFFLSGVKFDNSGNLFVMAIDLNDQNLASTIYKFTPGGVQSTFGSVPGQGFGLAFDSAGSLFAADSVDQTIWKFAPDGTRSLFVGPSAFNPGAGPIGLAFDGFGNLFVSTETGMLGDPSDGVLKFTPGGVGSPFATTGNNPRGLAFDRAGNLFVADVGACGAMTGGDILKFTPNGVGTLFAAVPGACNTGPEWLAFQLLPTPRPRPTPHPRPIALP
jgi:hypothetical protein